MSAPLAVGVRVVRLTRRVGLHDIGARGIVVTVEDLHGFELAVAFGRTAILCVNRAEVEALT